ncbi:MAG: RluA family pseudouridine synthase [Candidatus Adiutrix sp.]
MEPSANLTPSSSGAKSTLVVDPSSSGLRLDAFLAKHLSEYSRTQLAKMAKNGDILVGGRSARPSAVLSAGQTVIFPHPQIVAATLEPSFDVKIKAIYEDDHILVIDKPWGLMMHPGSGRNEATLAAGLLAQNPSLITVGDPIRPGLVHRLDKDTSGVVVTAKTSPALDFLVKMFSERGAEKKYLAFVFGNLKNSWGRIEAPIGRHPTLRHKMAAGVPLGREAVTFYRRLKYFPKTHVSLVALTLLTGRTHQARVHLQSLGLPVLGDLVYSRGAKELYKKFPALTPLVTRQLLHARRLTITHPEFKNKITFHAPWPNDFLSFFKTLISIENETKA